MKYCLIIPHYNHHRQFIAFIPKLAATGLVCVVVDDGSCEESREQVRSALSAHAQMHFFSHKVNRGKGAAIKTGVCHALNLGFTHGIQIDADGQHNAADIAKFKVCSESQPENIICGRPVFDKSVPKIRLLGRRITDFWVAVETLSLAIKDGLCGFRVYPLHGFNSIVDRYHLGSRMDFDTEILVKAVWYGTQLTFIDTAVTYPKSGVSHFKYLRDNIILVRLHTRLLLGMVPRFPRLIYRALLISRKPTF